MVGSGLTDATRWGRSRCVIRVLPLCRGPNVCLGSHSGSLIRWKHLNLRIRCCVPIISSLRGLLVNAPSRPLAD